MYIAVSNNAHRSGYQWEVVANSVHNSVSHYMRYDSDKGRDTDETVLDHVRNTVYDVHSSMVCASPLRRVCSVRCAVCGVQCAGRSVRCEVCVVRRAVCGVLYASCCMRRVACSRRECGPLQSAP